MPRASQWRDVLCSLLKQHSVSSSVKYCPSSCPLTDLIVIPSGYEYYYDASLSRAAFHLPKKKKKKKNNPGDWSLACQSNGSGRHLPVQGKMHLKNQYNVQQVYHEGLQHVGQMTLASSLLNSFRPLLITDSSIKHTKTLPSLRGLLIGINSTPRKSIRRDFWCAL